jgi:hypothetical protein
MLDPQTMRNLVLASLGLAAVFIACGFPRAERALMRKRWSSGACGVSSPPEPDEKTKHLRPKRSEGRYKRSAEAGTRNAADDAYSLAARLHSLSYFGNGVWSTQSTHPDHQ